MRATIDSNILVYASAGESGEKHRIASELLIKAMSHDVVMTVQALAEYLNVIRRKHPVHFAAARAQAERWATTFTIVDTTIAHLLNAADFALRHRLQFWDSVIWQAARSAQATLFLSEDLQDGMSLDGMSVLNPFRSENEVRMKALFAD